MSSVEVFRPGLKWNFFFNLIGDCLVYIFTLIIILIGIKNMTKPRKSKLSALFKIDMVLIILFVAA
jgi:hypothetical protein